MNLVLFYFLFVCYFYNNFINLLLVIVFILIILKSLFFLSSNFKTNKKKKNFVFKIYSTIPTSTYSPLPLLPPNIITNHCQIPAPTIVTHLCTRHRRRHPIAHHELPLPSPITNHTPPLLTTSTNQLSLSTPTTTQH